ncbi:MAG: copper resistance protein B [Caulobacteraceae bacterium]|nr:copper resistance protein B [Caulobacteraceae bacterium]
MTRLLVALAPLVLAAGAAQAQTNPHAGHVMPPATQPQSRPQPAPDPHAGHAMSGATTQADPHAGHEMSNMPAAAPADPHAGHDMSSMATPAQTDPHAGHDMSGMNMGAPDVPTSANTPGRPPEAPPPAAALTGPAHAADLVFGADAMPASRQTLIVENGDVRTTAVIIDRIEAGFGDGSAAYLWDVQGWTGGDINRFWWKSEGKGDLDGKLEDAEIQALYSRAITPFWDLQAGVRQDFRPDGPDTTHAVLGIQGLAPYWWEVDAAAFLSTEGDLTARVEAEYDQRITQRLILQPRFEIEASASNIPELEIGSGLSSVQAGLRLRYEIRKEFAPYIGVEWTRSVGDTADYVRARGGEPDDTRFVVGLKAWF